MRCSGETQPEGASSPLGRQRDGQHARPGPGRKTPPRRLDGKPREPAAPGRKTPTPWTGALRTKRGDAQTGKPREPAARSRLTARQGPESSSRKETHRREEKEGQMGERQEV